MPKLRLCRDSAVPEDVETPDVYLFPVDAAREMGSGLLESDSDQDLDTIGDIERALDRMQDRLDDLSADLDSLPFPGVRGDGQGPRAA